MNKFTFIATTRIWQLAVINLTALVFILLGGVALGVAPALAATLHAVHRLDSLSAGQLARIMWATYRAEFVRANAVCLPVLASAVALIWVGPALGTYGFALAICFALIALCYTAATLLITAHIDATLPDTLHNARLALTLSPYGHLIVLLALGPWLWLIWQLPLIGFYVGLSLPAFVYSGVVLPAIRAGFPAPITPIFQQEVLT